MSIVFTGVPNGLFFEKSIWAKMKQATRTGIYLIYFKNSLRNIKVGLIFTK